MPGLLGIASTRAPEVAERSFQAARDRMLRHPDLEVVTVCTKDRRCIIGDIRVSRHASPPAAVAQRGKVLVHGVVYNEKALREDSAGPSAADGGIGPLLAHQYVRHGIGFVDRLRGEFSLVLLDEERARLLIATDAIGSYPIYWREDADGLVFSSDLSALLKATPSMARLDMRAVADYMTIGAVFGDKTLAAGVRVIDPGTVLEYDIGTGALSQHRYVEIDSFFGNRTGSRANYLEGVQSAFGAAVDRALCGEGQKGLSLSGGLDSRAILGAVNSRSTSFRTYTLGVEGCADQVIAGRLAAIAGTRHTFFRLDETYLRDFLPNMAQMVSHTDGMYLSHGLTEILAIQFLHQTPIEVLLRGHGGELAKTDLAWPLHTDARIYQMRAASELVPYLSHRANYITRGLPLSRFLLAAAAKLAGDGTQTTFEEALAGTPLSPAQCCSYLYLRELNRRFTVPSLELFRSTVEVRLPFLDRDFLGVLLSAPPEWRDDTSILKALAGAGRPKLLQVRNSNTGAPANAGPLTEFAFDKVNTVLKRLNVHGFRHYHNFDSWMRSTLLESVEAELMAPHARVQSFLDRRALEELLRETRQGAADRGYLLQILLILELWMRENGVEAVA